MEIHRYYVTRRESIYCLVAGMGLLLSYQLIEEIGLWMISRSFDLGNMIIRFSSLLKVFGAAFGALFLLSFLRSRRKPKFSVCSNFLIMGYFDTEIVSWKEIHSIRIVGNNLRVEFDLDSIKVTRKKSIKHVRNKEDLIKEIKEYCGKYEIEFSQEQSK
jgi:hypothetical protein